MPDKITSRNLHYEQKLPPFLAKLRGQQVSSSSSPDPILAARRRPGRVRSASEEAEDAPVVVDEEGNVVHVDPKTLAQEDDGGEDNETKNDENHEKQEHDKKEPERVAGIGSSRKRKAGRVVGGSDDEDADIARAVKAVREAAGKGSRGEGQDAKKHRGKEEKSEAKDVKKGGKKKVKKIKLSFGDDEGE